MVELKSQIEEASSAVDIERGKNVALLNLIFPPDVARQLWAGIYTIDYEIIILKQDNERINSAR